MAIAVDVSCLGASQSVYAAFLEQEPAFDNQTVCFYIKYVSATKKPGRANLIVASSAHAQRPSLAPLTFRRPSRGLRRSESPLAMSEVERRRQCTVSVRIDALKAQYLSRRHLRHYSLKCAGAGSGSRGQSDSLMLQVELGSLSSWSP